MAVAIDDVPHVEKKEVVFHTTTSMPPYVFVKSDQSHAELLSLSSGPHLEVGPEAVSLDDYRLNNLAKI